MSTPGLSISIGPIYSSVYTLHYTSDYFLIRLIHNTNHSNLLSRTEILATISVKLQQLHNLFFTMRPFINIKDERSLKRNSSEKCLPNYGFEILNPINFLGLDTLLNNFIHLPLKTDSGCNIKI